MKVYLSSTFMDLKRHRAILGKALHKAGYVSTYKEQAYKLVPDARIDYEHLVEQWDNILRFVASIKLSYTQASNDSTPTPGSIRSTKH